MAECLRQPTHSFRPKKLRLLSAGNSPQKIEEIYALYFGISANVQMAGDAEEGSE